MKNKEISGRATEKDPSPMLDRHAIDAVCIQNEQEAYSSIISSSETRLGLCGSVHSGVSLHSQ